MLAAVSTEHKIGMLVVAGTFIAFALASSFLFPRYWPQFPGARGRSAFIVAAVALTVAMLLAVEFFAVEEEEAEAGDHPAAVEDTTTTATTEAAETTTEAATTTTGSVETTTTAEAQTVNVSGTEFSFALTPDEVHPGVVVFRLKNDGQIGHDLKVEGPGVDDAKTPVIEPGQTADVEVELQAGDYELYCTVPGHREGGMDVDLTVG